MTGTRIYRHTISTRLTHWVNFLCVTILLMSGLQILNAHPRLYWGEAGAQGYRPFIAFTAERAGENDLRGFTQIGALRFETTGFLGVSEQAGRLIPRGIPGWATLPSYRDLATGRRWHFFFAWLFVFNGVAYLAFSIGNGHLRRDLALSRDELKPRNIWADIIAHVRLHVARGEASKRYNITQKLVYIAAIFMLLPLMLLTGLAMSPGMNAAAPFLLDLFGGRQSARTLHFLTAFAIIAFVIVHVGQVFLAGFKNEMRSMITGWFEP